MGDAGATSAVYASRPSIRLDDQDEVGLKEGLLSMLVEERSAGLCRCEATFGNWGAVGGEPDFLYLDRQLLDYGKPIQIRAGDGDTDAQLFDGLITALEATYPQTRPPEITVLAEDRFQDLRMTRRTRTFEDETDRAVFERIASDHGLRNDVDVDGPTYRVLAQLNQSDLAFLRDLRAIDAELWIEGDTLFAVARSRLDRGEIEMSYGQGLHEFSVLADVANQRTSLAVTGWDVSAKEGVEYEATDTAVQGELNGDLSGAAVLREAFGDRVERVVHAAPFDQAEAQAVAEARFRRMARRFVVGRGIGEGDGRIRVGARVRLSGVGAPLEGAYEVTDVRHLFEADRGFSTWFRVERPGIATT